MEERKYKIGNMEFQSEAEYMSAASDLKKIKALTENYDISNPAQAQKILAEIYSRPNIFKSDYGKRFVSQLERTAGVSGEEQEAEEAETPVTENNVMKYSYGNGPENIQDGTGRKKKGKKKKKKWVIVVGIILFLSFISMLLQDDEENVENKEDKVAKIEKESDAGDVSSDSEKTEDLPTVEKEVEENEAKEEVTYDAWKGEYSKKNASYLSLNFLYKNAEYYKGKTVLSVGNIYELSDDYMQFDISDDNFFKEFTCNMADKEELEGLEESDKVCFIGTVSETNSFLGTETVVLDNCYIMEVGDGAKKYSAAIKKKSEKNKEYVSNAKKEEQERAEQEKKNAFETYVAECESVPYEDVQRNPDKYKEKKVSVTGKVIQVSEGWFDTVVFRIEDSSLNVWYVNYTYSDGESRVIEEDNVTLYGECTGTETYTALLGNSVTIPAVDGKYIIIN